MPASVTCNLLNLWTEKERIEGRRITVQEIAEITGLSRDTISGYLKGETTRFDAPVLVKLCEYFGVSGGPIPFIIFIPDKGAPQ